MGYLKYSVMYFSGDTKVRNELKCFFCPILNVCAMTILMHC